MNKENYTPRWFQDIITSVRYNITTMDIILILTIIVRAIDHCFGETFDFCVDNVDGYGSRYVFIS